MTDDNSYRRHQWLPENMYKYSHYAILDKINPETDHVVDIGCGANMFHGKIKNLVAFDPVPCADSRVPPYLITTLEDFEPDQKFNVALCLGSIQFGNEDRITKQIEKVNSMLTPSAKVFWRFRLESDAMTRDFQWTLLKLQKFADLYGFTQQEEHIDTNLAGIMPRQYVEWVR